MLLQLCLCCSWTKHKRQFEHIIMCCLTAETLIIGSNNLFVFLKVFRIAAMKCRENQSWYITEPIVQPENPCFLLQYTDYQVHYLLEWKNRVKKITLSLSQLKRRIPPFPPFQWQNNYQPSWQYRSNTVHHCTLKRRSPFINIKPIWAEKTAVSKWCLHFCSDVPT